MAQFCGYCGKAIPAGQAFCPYCGSPAAGGGGIPAPGFSQRVNDPEILAAVKKNKKAGAAFGFVLIPLPLLGFLIYSLVSDSMETKDALLYGGIVSAVFLVSALIGAVRSRASAGYEAVVTDQKSGLEYRHRSGDPSDRSRVMKYTTTVRTTDGKKKTIVEWEGPQIWAYHYLKVGDRFRYHPQFNFPYELYDKSKAPWIACVSCGMKNPVSEDRCGKCGIPLLK